MVINKIPNASFAITCRNAYLNGLHPFDSNIDLTDSYINLSSIVERLSLHDFIGYLMEGQYNINLWAAFFILDKFRPDINEKLIGMNDEKSIVKDCIETVDTYATNFTQESQKDNYTKWMSEVKFRYNL
jgi:hypothetical protein